MFDQDNDFYLISLTSFITSLLDNGQYMDITRRDYMSISSGNLGVNPSTPKSDKHLISPYNISPESLMKVTRIKEMITN